MKPYYITTPLYYVNAEPHIGHAYTTVAADVLARFMRARGREAHLLTGTDEHGAKIAAAAAAAGISPQAWADKISGSFLELWKHLDVHHDEYIRTTEERHKNCVAAVFSALKDSGDIYKGRYSGFYCLSCESYWTDKEAPEIEGKRKCQYGMPKAAVLSKKSIFQALKIPGTPDGTIQRGNVPPAFQPSQRIVRFVMGVETFRYPAPGQMGIWFRRPTPSTSGSTPSSYVSALGFQLGGSPAFQRPLARRGPDRGQGNRFHAVTGPAMRMAGNPRPGLRLRLVDVSGKKMSKSLGNFIDPREVTREFGVDAFRYFLMREVPFGNDGDFSIEALRKRYNAELANDLGNLLSRVLEMVDKYIQGNLPKRPALEEDFKTSQIAKRSPEIAAAMERLAFSEALEIIWSCVRLLNEHVNATAPWKLFKTDPDKVKPILFDLVWSLRIIAGWIEPFMPRTAAAMQAQLGVRQFPMPLTPEEVLHGPNGDRIQKGPPLFPPKDLNRPLRAAALVFHFLVQRRRSPPSLLPRPAFLPSSSVETALNLPSALRAVAPFGTR